MPSLKNPETVDKTKLTFRKLKAVFDKSEKIRTQKPSYL
jgi:hypothetical protein